MNAAFASTAERGGGRGFKSRPVHYRTNMRHSLFRDVLFWKNPVFNIPLLLVFKYEGGNDLFEDFEAGSLVRTLPT